MWNMRERVKYAVGEIVFLHFLKFQNFRNFFETEIILIIPYNFCKLFGAIFACYLGKFCIFVIFASLLSDFEHFSTKGTYLRFFLHFRGRACTFPPPMYEAAIWTLASTPPMQSPQGRAAYNWDVAHHPVLRCWWCVCDGWTSRPIGCILLEIFIEDLPKPFKIFNENVALGIK